MQGKKVLIGALFGAIVGALSSSISFRGIVRIPALMPDQALLRHRPFLLAGVAAWVLFGAYWQIAATNAAANRSAESRASRRLHVFLANLAFVLIFIPIHGLGRLLPAAPPLMAAGLAVEVTGLLLALWARRHLGRNWSGEITIKEEHQLIRSGPYRLLRHPIYTGLLAMYFGLALVTGEWLAAIGVAVAALAYWRKIRLEEKVLDEAFVKDYGTYRRTTWAIVPGIF